MPWPAITATPRSWWGSIEANPGRLAVHLSRLAEAGLDVSGVITGHPDELERVITETRADRVIITSPDYTHADLIVRAWTPASTWWWRSR